MKKTMSCIASILICTLAASISLAQAQEHSKDAAVNSRDETRSNQLQLTHLLAQARSQRRAGFVLMPAINNAAASGPAFSITPATGPSLPVTGSGTLGRLAKWGGNSVIVDSNIFEDKFGKVGIGTAAPTSLLTVQGMIETFGGIKFADGTTQTTSTAGALFGVAHDETLQGNGTTASPLGVAVPLSLSGAVFAHPLITVSNLGQLGAGVSVTGGFLGDGVIATGGTGGGGVSATGGSDGGTGIDARGGDSSTGFGGTGISASGGTGVEGIFEGLAGNFHGGVIVNGDLSVGGTLFTAAKLFRIDHPLDPENRYLNHVSIESPDMKNIYDGNVVTDENGEAVVLLADYFEALNRDFRYQLTVIGTFAQAIIAEEVKGNRFLIRTNAANVKVSWQVTGIRQDAWANKNRIKVEVEKSERERGYYLHPEVFNQPAEKSIEWARNPEMMQRLKQQRLEAEDKIKKQR